MCASPDPFGYLAWSAGVLMPALPPPEPASVVDSWLVSEGRTRGLGSHRDRFAAACESRHGVPVAETARFFTAACAVVPRARDWFPRVEFRADHGFGVLPRPVSPAPPEVVLWVPGSRDPRTEPRFKGPDLAALTGLRSEAAGHGASEALLVSVDGIVLEGALSAV